MASIPCKYCTAPLLSVCNRYWLERGYYEYGFWDSLVFNGLREKMVRQSVALELGGVQCICLICLICFLMYNNCMIYV